MADESTRTQTLIRLSHSRAHARKSTFTARISGRFYRDESIFAATREKILEEKRTELAKLEGEQLAAQLRAQEEKNTQMAKKLKQKRRKLKEKKRLLRLQRRAKRKELAAMVVQRAWRGFVGRQLACLAELELYSALVIQQNYRSHRRWVEQLQQRKHRVRRKCAISIQSLVRGHSARKLCAAKRDEAQAALCLQRVWRGHCGRKLANQARAEAWREICAYASVTIQRVYRGYRGRCAYATVVARWMAEHNRQMAMMPCLRVGYVAKLKAQEVNRGVEAKKLAEQGFVLGATAGGGAGSDGDGDGDRSVVHGTTHSSPDGNRSSVVHDTTHSSPPFVAHAAAESGNEQVATEVPSPATVTAAAASAIARLLQRDASNLSSKASVRSDRSTLNMPAADELVKPLDLARARLESDSSDLLSPTTSSRPTRTEQSAGPEAQGTANSNNDSNSSSDNDSSSDSDWSNGDHDGKPALLRGSQSTQQQVSAAQPGCVTLPVVSRAQQHAPEVSAPLDIQTTRDRSGGADFALLDDEELAELERHELAELRREEEEQELAELRREEEEQERGDAAIKHLGGGDSRADPRRRRGTSFLSSSSWSALPALATPTTHGTPPIPAAKSRQQRLEPLQTRAVSAGSVLGSVNRAAVKRGQGDSSNSGKETGVDRKARFLRALAGKAQPGDDVGSEAAGNAELLSTERSSEGGLLLGRHRRRRQQQSVRTHGQQRVHSASEGQRPQKRAGGHQSSAAERVRTEQARDVRVKARVERRARAAAARERREERQRRLEAATVEAFISSVDRAERAVAPESRARELERLEQARQRRLQRSRAKQAAARQQAAEEAAAAEAHDLRAAVAFQNRRIFERAMEQNLMRRRIRRSLARKKEAEAKARAEEEAAAESKRQEKEAKRAQFAAREAARLEKVRKAGERRAKAAASAKAAAKAEEAARSEAELKEKMARAEKRAAEEKRALAARRQALAARKRREAAQASREEEEQRQRSIQLAAKAEKARRETVARLAAKKRREKQLAEEERAAIAAKTARASRLAEEGQVRAKARLQQEAVLAEAVELEAALAEREMMARQRLLQTEALASGMALTPTSHMPSAQEDVDAALKVVSAATVKRAVQRRHAHHGGGGGGGSSRRRKQKSSEVDDGDGLEHALASARERHNKWEGEPRRSSKVVSRKALRRLERARRALASERGAPTHTAKDVGRGGGTDRQRSSRPQRRRHRQRGVDGGAKRKKSRRQSRPSSPAIPLLAYVEKARRALEGNNEAEARASGEEENGLGPRTSPITTPRASRCSSMPSVASPDGNDGGENSGESLSRFVQQTRERVQATSIDAVGAIAAAATAESASAADLLLVGGTDDPLRTSCASPPYPETAHRSPGAAGTPSTPPAATPPGAATPQSPTRAVSANWDSRAEDATTRLNRALAMMRQGSGTASDVDQAEGGQDPYYESDFEDDE